MTAPVNKSELTALLRLLDSAGDLLQILISRSYDQQIEYSGPDEVLQIINDSKELQTLMEINAYLIAAKIDVLDVLDMI